MTLSTPIWSQDQASFTGSLETNANIFIRDSLIGADNTPQYDHQLFGGEAWLSLNYKYKGYTIGARVDFFSNSNLRNPNDSYSDQGLGRWFIQKRIDKLEIEIGHIYDQIGSGIIYRAYESRPLFIDNALLGASLGYDINDDWKIKAFSGRQKFIFDTYDSSIKGLYLEGYLSLGNENSPITLAPGFGFVNRTLSDENMAQIVGIIKDYTDVDRIKPIYNAYLGTFYNTLTYKGFNWYLETAVKSKDAFFDPRAVRTEINGESTGKFVKEAGSVIYSSLSFAKGRLGITLEGKRTENFNIRANPLLALNLGLLNYIPPMNAQNTYRLTSRYNPATQDLSEQAIQADVKYKFNKKLDAELNYSNIQTLDGEQLYEEYFVKAKYKPKRTLQFTAGVQRQVYNQPVYEEKPLASTVETITPFAEVLYKFSRKRSLRTEVQFMKTDEDFGSWGFLLLEYNTVPHWIFEISGMYNISPSEESPKDPETGESKKLLYPTVGVTYLKKTNRFSLRYVKQVEGVVCTGGICRLEPGFSGFKFSVNSTF